MTGTAKTAEHESSGLAHLAAEAVSKLDCRSFHSFRSAARDVAELHSGIWREAVNMYDPNSPDGFSDLITYFAGLFSDKREAALVFGVALSTFYRWKGGESVPHPLVRATIRDTISRYLCERQFDQIGSVGGELSSRLHGQRARPN